MMTHKTRNAILATVGLAALTIYILACTSFSPDDTKLLYPASDAESGALGLAVYDREARRSEMLFLPVAFEGKTNDEVEVASRVVRGQWLADGHGILIAWAGGNQEGLNLALLPWGAKGATKVFCLPDLKDAAMYLQMPLCVAGERVFFMSGDKKPTEAVRIDLRTGAAAIHEFTETNKQVSLYPAPDGSGVFYVESQDQRTGFVFGRLDPESFNRTSLIVSTNEVADKSDNCSCRFFAYDTQGKAVGFLEETQEVKRLVVLRQGKPAFTRPVGAKGEERLFGSVGFSPKGVGSGPPSGNPKIPTPFPMG